jgi:hypothetical protein
LKNGDTRIIYRALRKYEMGDSFELIVIDTATTMEELCEKEIGYILECNSYYIDGHGYNMTRGGEGTVGYVHTDDDKQKISEAVNKHYVEHPEARQQMREISIRYHENNPEAAKEQSIRIKKYFEESPNAREKCSESQIKRFENPAEREKYSKNSKKQWENPDARQQMSEIKKKYFEVNPEIGTEVGEKLKKYYEDNPSAREKQSNTSKKQWENPVARQQMSEIKRKYFEENPNARRKILDGRKQNKLFDVFALDGTFIKSFNYQCEAKEYLQEEHHISSTITIGPVLSGKQKSSAGFVFKYKTI